MIVGCIYFINR